jgi:hypothetical protein
MLMRCVFLQPESRRWRARHCQTNGKPVWPIRARPGDHQMRQAGQAEAERRRAYAAGDDQAQQARRAQRGVIELDRVIIYGEAELPGSPEEVIARALSRAPVRAGETSFATGESAQCTCMNLCPPPPFPCCQCTDRVGSRLSSSPGWAPTR